MTDISADPWRQFIESGRALRLEVDRLQVTATLKRNTRYLLVTGGICVVVLGVLVALLATGIGRAVTYVLLAILLAVMLGNVGLGLISRRRVLKTLAVEDAFIEVDATGVRLAGVPPLTWGQTLGVVVSDNRATMDQGNGLGRRLRKVTYGTGGSLNSVVIGLGDMRSVRAAASGPRVASLDLGMHDHGAVVLNLDVALEREQCDQVREALRAATALNGVPFRFTSDNGNVAQATLEMGRGDRLTVA
ncbi:hypothetical protein [Microbacterium ureisolvens]|uniref:Uncharacterized protein n=1 Tax=Microbacterium ureisolvens TaxID=2781186 RepID=A0ABS7HYS5_9MICO|nr:hypothetical protein [Microbacterium ureisolvens]MBW9110547.1 hypothetical protein [Microbacterium ureisolvens]